MTEQRNKTKDRREKIKEWRGEEEQKVTYG